MASWTWKDLHTRSWRNGPALRDSSALHMGAWWNLSRLPRRVCSCEGPCEVTWCHLPANLSCIFQQERFLFILQGFTQSIQQPFTTFQNMGRWTLREDWSGVEKEVLAVRQLNIIFLMSSLYPKAWEWWNLPQIVTVWLTSDGWPHL